MWVRVPPTVFLITKGFNMENIKDMKELLQTRQEMQEKNKKSTGTMLAGFVVSLILVWVFFAWATFSVVSVLRLMNVI